MKKDLKTDFLLIQKHGGVTITSLYNSHHFSAFFMSETRTMKMQGKDTDLLASSWSAVQYKVHK